MDPKEQSISRQAEKALREAVDEVVEEARRTNGTLAVWEDGAVRQIPADQLPPPKRPSP